MGISVGGLASGLDTESIISQISQLQKRPILQLQRQEAAYQLKLSAFGNLQSSLNSLKSVMEALDEVNDFQVLSAVSGNTDLFTVSADSKALQGQYNISVQQLAGVHKLTSAAFSEGESVGAGIIHLRLGDGEAVDISVSEGDTLETVARAINDSKAGVTAGVVFDGTDYFLTLSGTETGENQVINLTVTDTGDDNHTDMNGLSRLVYDQNVTENLVQSQAAKDAIITVDGVNNIRRPTNILSDVIDGVTITLKSEPAPPDNGSSLTVSRNNSAIKGKVENFVSAYNKLVDLMKAFQTYNAETKTAGALLGDSTARLIQGRLTGMLSREVSGIESFSRLSDLGITVDKEGYLKVDSATLDTAINDHFDDFTQFFAQKTEGSEGFALKMKEVVNAFVSSTQGMLTARTKGIQTTIKGLQKSAERIEARVAASEATLRAQFNTLETLLAKYQATETYLGQQINSLNNLNSYISNR